MAARIAVFTDYLTAANKIWFSASFSFVRNFRSTSIKRVGYVYQLEIKTGNVFGAGTDANVYIRIIGEKGSTEEVKLQTFKGDLERGMVNNYRFSADHVGKLHKIIVRHDNTGIGPAWYLEKVMVKDNRGKLYHFPCNDWLSKGKDNSTKVLLRVEDSQEQNNHFKSPKNKKVTGRRLEVVSTVSGQFTPDEGLTAVMKRFLDVNENHDGHYQPSSLLTEEVHISQSTKHSSSLSPAVRYLIDTYGVDLFKVPSSGPQGRVLKGDVLKYLLKNKITEKRKLEQTPVPNTQYSVSVAPKQRPLQISDVAFVDHVTSEGERSRANSFIASKFQVPHIYLSSKCYLNNLDKCVEGLNNEYNKDCTSVVIARAFMDALTVISGAVNIKGTVNVSTSTSNFQVTEENSLDIEHSMESLHMTQNMEIVDVKPAPFSLNILQNEEVSFVSCILNPNEILSVTLSGVQFSIDQSGKVMKTSRISLTCDGSVIADVDSALFLDRLVKNIENPVHMMLIDL